MSATGAAAVLVVGGLVTGLAGSAASAAGAYWPEPRPGQVRQVTSLPVDPASFGSFAESMAADGSGGLVVSTTTWWTDWQGVPIGDGHNKGHLYRVGTDGRTSEMSAPLDLGIYGMQTGVAVDGSGATFVGFASFAADPAPGVFRVGSDGVPVRWMTLPADAFPNGVLVVGTDVYVSDSALGVVWKGSTRGPSSPSAPWFADTRLAPDPSGFGIGANGMAVRGTEFLVACADRGLVLRLPLLRSGAAGPASVLAQDARLLHADGLAVDVFGRLWVTVNEGPADTGTLVSIDQHGALAVVPLRAGLLDYPVQAVTWRGSGEMYVLNGGIFGTGTTVLAISGLVPGGVAR